MKLYATVSSERATKGQGGKDIEIVITCRDDLRGTNDLIMRIRTYTDSNGNILLRCRSLISEQDMDVRLPERYKVRKGNKQKGEVCEHGRDYDENCSACQLLTRD